MNKKILLSGAGVVLVGGVAAYTILDKTPKQAYFEAEAHTFETAMEFLSERYEPEMKWYETQMEKPTQSNLSITAQVDTYDFNLSSIIDSATLNITTQSDPKKSEHAVKLGASIFDIDVDQFGLYLTKEAIYAEVPFQPEALKLDFEKLGDLIELTTGENLCLENMDMENLFSTTVISEKDREYLKEKYGKTIFKALPDEAFKNEDGKMTMTLKGTDVQNALIKVLETAASDKKLHTIIRNVVLASDACNTIEIKEEIEEILNNVKDQTYDYELKSVIWVEDKVVVKRELTVETFTLTATQSIDKSLSFDYKLTDTPTDGFEPTTISFSGKLGSGKSFEDRVELGLDGTTVAIYEGNEALNGKTREFSRSILIPDFDYQEVSIGWSGEMTYNGDTAIGEHRFEASADSLGSIGLTIEADSKVIKKVSLPSKTVNITNMSETEMQNYFNDEFMQNFSDWAQDNFMGLQYLFY